MEYKGDIISFNDSKLYKKYKDKEGESIEANVETREYDDGSMSYKVVEIIE